MPARKADKTAKVTGPEPARRMAARGKAPTTRGVELISVDDLDERQIAAWMSQVATLPGIGGKKR